MMLSIYSDRIFLQLGKFAPSKVHSYIKVEILIVETLLVSIVHIWGQINIILIGLLYRLLSQLPSLRCGMPTVAVYTWALLSVELCKW